MTQKINIAANQSFCKCAKINIDNDIKTYALIFLQIFNTARENKDIFYKIENDSRNNIFVYYNMKFEKKVIDYLSSFEGAKIENNDIMPLFTVDYLPNVDENFCFNFDI